MTDIVVTPLVLKDRARWAELWHGYLDFYETRLPPEIYEHTWQRLIAAESPIRGLGARRGSATAPLAGSPITSFTRMPGRRKRSAIFRISSSTAPFGAAAAAAD